MQWFADEDTPEERKLIFKLDLMIVPYAFLAYWAKYIDQANLSEFGQPCQRKAAQHNCLHWLPRKTTHTSPV